MQVVRSIILLQAMEHPGNDELQKLVKNTEDKIQAISLVHQMLYKSHDLSRISIREYIEELADLIMCSFSITDNRISLNMKIDDQKFLLDTAIPFGLIINELMTNSLKYAFPDNRKGLISISLNCDDSDRNIFYFSDNGVGVSGEFDFRKQKTLGIKLIQNIGELQMLGKVVFENNNGISCMIEFPARLYKARV
jgi:two-component sensor histidine kinase